MREPVGSRLPRCGYFFFDGGGRLCSFSVVAGRCLAVSSVTNLPVRESR